MRISRDTKYAYEELNTVNDGNSELMATYSKQPLSSPKKSNSNTKMSLKEMACQTYENREESRL